MAMAAVIGALVAAPPAGAAPTPAGPASPGVTDHSVTVGSISDISLPLPGLFLGAKVGTEAYFAYVNAKGGVHGRKLVLDARDSAFSSGTVADETRSIARDDFAMVGGFSLLDQAEQPVVDGTHLPDVTQPLAPTLMGDANVYSGAPEIPNGNFTGAMKWLAETYPGAVKATGGIGTDAAASAEAGERMFQAIARSAGWKWRYTRDAGYAETTFLPDIVKMKDLGVTMVFESAQPANTIATIAQEMRQQGLHARLAGPASLYARNFDAGSAGDGAIFFGNTALYMGEDARVVPAVATFDTWVKKVQPSSNLDLYTLFGWISGELFVQALENAGRHPTRASLRAALDRITSFDADGLVTSGDPARNLPSQCWLVARYEHGTWHRFGPDPKSGFVCHPSGLYPPTYRGISR
jgi:ABC-type branched-subunit amino acid transport system substrate-binding protein